VSEQIENLILLETKMRINKHQVDRLYRMRDKFEGTANYPRFFSLFIKTMNEFKEIFDKLNSIKLVVELNKLGK
jgi:hypothetical protein